MVETNVTAGNSRLVSLFREDLDGTGGLVRCDIQGGPIYHCRNCHLKIDPVWVRTKDGYVRPTCGKCFDRAGQTYGNPTYPATTATELMEIGNGEQNFCTTQKCINLSHDICCQCGQEFCRECISYTGSYPICLHCLNKADGYQAEDWSGERCMD